LVATILTSAPAAAIEAMLSFAVVMRSTSLLSFSAGISMCSVLMKSAVFRPVRERRDHLGASAMVLFVAFSPGTAVPPVARIPLCPGLTIVTAVSQPEGDYESIKTIESIDKGDVSLRYSAERKIDGALRKIKVQRATPIADLKTASIYLHHFDPRTSIRIPGATAIGTSSAVLRALKAKGEAELAVIESTGSTFPANRHVSPNLYDYQLVATISRVGTVTVPVSVTVNDTKVALPAIHARGDYFGDKAEFFFLDDEQNPIALRYRIGRDALDVVKVSYACSATPDSVRTEPSALERALTDTGRADVYSIYFSFNSDEIREESDPTLTQIADLLSRHRDWKLSIVGHTDSIASDTYNLELSKRRAAAVRNALVGRHKVEAVRLTTSGAGEASPKDTNDTLEGRARNRRVELVRMR
jgi:outer membrane protein OmpA-like peptidoglycan-associated protein